MIEIFVLISLSRKIARIASDRGRSGAGYIFLLLGLWFGGEIVGAIIGIPVAMLVDNDDAAIFVIYPFCLVGAAVGAFTAFTIAKAMPPVERGFDQWDDDDDDDPRRRTDGRNQDGIQER